MLSKHLQRAVTWFLIFLMVFTSFPQYGIALDGTGETTGENQNQELSQEEKEENSDGNQQLDEIEKSADEKENSSVLMEQEDKKAEESISDSATKDAETTEKSENEEKPVNTMSLGAPAPGNSLLAAPSTATASDPYFDIYWIKGLDTTESTMVDAQGHITEIKDTPVSDINTQYVSAQVEFQVGRTSDANPIKAGDIQIALDRWIFQEWDWDRDGTRELYTARSDTKPWQTQADPTVGVGKKDSKTGKNFWFYFGRYDDALGKYVEDPDGDKVVIENYDSLATVGNAPITFTSTINYPYLPSKIDETVPHKLNADFKVLADGYGINVNRDNITARVNTTVGFHSVEKRLSGISNGGQFEIPSTKWNSTWGNFSDTGLSGTQDDYYYIQYEIVTFFSGNESNAENSTITQPFKIWITEETPGYSRSGYNGNNQGKIVAFGGWGTSALHTPKWYTDNRIDEETGDVRFEFADPGNPMTVIGNFFGSYDYANTHRIGEDRTKKTATGSGFGTSSNGWMNFRSNIVVAYPKTYIDSLKSSETGASDYMTNLINVRVEPYNGDPKEDDYYTYHRPERIEFNYKPFGPSLRKYNYIGGSRVIGREEDPYYGNRDSRPMSTIRAGKWMLMDEQEVDLYKYQIAPSDRIYGFDLTMEELPGLNDPPRIIYPADPKEYGKRNYTVTIYDDMLFLNGSQLEAGDYAIESIELSGNGGILENPNMKNPFVTEPLKAKVFVRFDKGGSWTEVGTFEGSNTIKLADVLSVNKDVHGIKVEYTQNYFYISPTVMLEVKLKPTAHVQALLRGDMDEADVINVSSYSIQDSEGRYRYLQELDTVSGSGHLEQAVIEHDQKEYNLPNDKVIFHSEANQFLGDFEMDTTFTKTSSYPNTDDKERLMSRRSYTLTSDQKATYITDDPQALLSELKGQGVIHGQKEVTLYDLLPSGSTLDFDTLRVRVKDSASNYVDADFSYKLMDNFHNSGRTLLVLSVKRPQGVDPDFAERYTPSTKTLNLGSTVQASFTLIFDWNDISFYAEDGANNGKIVTNYAAVEVPGSGDGYPDDATKTDPSGNPVNFKEEFLDILSNLHDADGGESIGNDTYYSSVDTTFQIASASLTGYTKQVKGESESSYRTHSAVKPDESYSYRLRYAVDQGATAKDILIYDVLEYAFVDDSYLATGTNGEKYRKTGRHWLGTFDHVDVSTAEAMGVNVKVYYSTADRELLQKKMDEYSEGNTSEVSVYANLGNTEYWRPYNENDSSIDKTKITAIAFDCSEASDKCKEENYIYEGGKKKFIMNYDSEGKEALYLYIYMTAPDEEEVKNGADGKGSYVEPEYVYALNNSFLSIRTKPRTSDFWSDPGARMSDGTTVRIAEPNPPLYKQLEDSDELAGGTNQEEVEANKDTTFIKDPSEIVKYTITTRVPTLGTKPNGEDERNTFGFYDRLVDELEFVKTELVTITIGEEDSDYYFRWDPSASPKGKMKAWTKGYDSVDGSKIYEETTFDSLEELPDGFTYSLKTYNEGYGNTTSSPENRDNIILFTLGYDEENPDSPTYDRVEQFNGETITIEFYAKIREGANLGVYATGKVPNNAGYYIPGHKEEFSNTVYIHHPEEDEPPVKTVALVDGEGNVIGEEAQKFYVVNSSDLTYVHDRAGNLIVVTISYDDEGNEVLKDSQGEDYVLKEGQSIKTVQEMENLEEIIHYEVKQKLPGGVSNVTLKDNLQNALEIVPDSFKIKLVGQVVINKTKGERGWRMAGTDRDFRVYSDQEKADLMETYPSLTEESFIEDTYYRPVSDDEGTPETETLDIEREFDLSDPNDYFLLTRYSDRNFYRGYPVFNTKDNSWSLQIPGRFINQYGDALLSLKVTSKEVEALNSNGEPYTYTSYTAEKIDGELGKYGTSAINGPVEYSLAGVDLIVSFDARIKEGADLSRYLTETGYEIPNIATYAFGNNPEVDTEPVVVRPPREKIEKTVNNKIYETLGTQNEVVNYAINVEIPNFADDPETEVEETETVREMSIEDTLQPVLEFYEPEAKNVTAKVIKEDGTTVYNLTVPQREEGLKITGKKLVFDVAKALGEDFAQYTSGGYRFLLRFDARIVPGTTEEQLNPYRDGSTAEVPNEASYKINNQYTYESNVVHITPPTIGKTVNYVTDYYLSDLTEVFEYEVTSLMPANEENDVKSFVISDTLNKVLTFADPAEYPYGVTIGDEELSQEEISERIKVDGQTITLSFSEADVEKASWKKKAVLLTFKAVIKEGADLTDYWKKLPQGEYAVIPNRAEYVLTFDNGSTQNNRTKDVNVYVPKSEKKVNGEESVDLSSLEQVFTYSISTYIPTPPVSTETEEKEMKAATFYDELEPVLTFADKNDVKVKIDGKDTVTVDGADVALKSKVAFSGNRLSFDLLPYTAEYAGKKIEIEFTAKLKKDTTLDKLDAYVSALGIIEIPNEAVLEINIPNEAGEDVVTESRTQPVYVTPPPIQKKVTDNDETLVDDATLDSWDENFVYTINTRIPEVDANNDPIVSFSVIDRLVPELEFGDFKKAAISIGGVAVDNIEEIATFDLTKKVLTITFTEEQIQENLRGSVEITFPARIVRDADLSKYKDNGNRIPNKTSYKINNDSEVESNTVTVVPPPVVKTVNNRTAISVGDIDQTFTFRITGLVPATDNEETKVTGYVLEDTLVDALLFSGKPTVTIDGRTVSADTYIKTNKQTLTFTMDNPSDLEEYAGKKILIAFRAKVNPKADLTPYIEEDFRIPNEATAKIDFSDESSESYTTEPVTVTPPDGDKKVNGVNRDLLSSIYEPIKYTVRVLVPSVDEKGEEITDFVLRDKLEPVLKFSEDEEVSLTAGEAALDTEKYVSINDDTIQVKISGEELKAVVGKYLELEFVARIIDGADMSKYYVAGDSGKGVVSVPNTGKYVINNGEEIDTNTVTVDIPDITKKVSDSDETLVNDATLSDWTEEFTYTIDTFIPPYEVGEEKTTGFVIKDTLEDVLEFSDKEPNVTVNGETADAIVSRNGDVLEVFFDEAQVKKYELGSVRVVFNAVIKDGADLSPYIDDGFKVPNKAAYIINDKDEKESNTVTIVPPPVNKTVNDVESIGVDNLDEVFTFKLYGLIPSPVTGTGEEVTSFKLVDNMEKVLLFADEDCVVTIGDEEIASEGMVERPDEHTIVLTLDKETIAANTGKKVMLEFKAKFNPTADFAPYIKEITAVPNKAKAVVEAPNGTGYELESEPVTITPPDSKKTVNDADEFTVENLDEAFRYKIRVLIPLKDSEGNDIETFKLTDTLEPVLRFADEPNVVILVGDKDVDSQAATIEDQTITVEFGPEEMAEYRGAYVDISFDAMVKEGADLTSYIVEGAAKVPNTAEYSFNNSPEVEVTNTPSVVPPIPDTPGIKKLVNDKEHVDLKTVEEVFHYTIDTYIPSDAYAMTVTDTLESVLEFTNVDKITVKIGDTTLTPEEVKTQVTTKGKTLTVVLTRDQVIGNKSKEVQIMFDAKVVKNADLSSYRKLGKAKVPNTAEYMVNNNPDRVVKSNTVTVTPPNPTGPKTGDDNNVLPWMLLMLAAAIAIRLVEGRRIRIR